MSSIPDIDSLIPHRPPMLLVDQIISIEDNQITCTKQFRQEEYFFQGHYPDHPIVPGVILCEAAMQAGAALLSSNFSDNMSGGVPVATRINDVRLKQMVAPGDCIEINVTLDEQVSNAFFMTARVTLEGKMAVRFQFACTMATPSDNNGNE